MLALSLRGASPRKEAVVGRINALVRKHSKKALYATLSLTWASLAALYFYVPPSPMVPISGDTATPSIVKVGDIVTVSRNFKITRAAPFKVVRTMVQGDCARNCEIIELSSSSITRQPGVYVGNTRELVIPQTADPGQWVLQYTLHWNDWFGRAHSRPMPPLTIQIIP